MSQFHEAHTSLSPRRPGDDVQVQALRLGVEIEQLARLDLLHGEAGLQLGLGEEDEEVEAPRPGRVGPELRLGLERTRARGPLGRYG